MALVDRLDRLQRRHPAAGFPIAVVYKYVDDTGPFLSALITYYAFVSLFPLLLLSSTILGAVLDGNPELQERLIDSALSQLPVVGEQLGEPQGLSGGTWGVVIGILGALYGALGVAQAVQHAMNTAWTVPRNNRPNPFLARGRSLLLLATAGLTVVGTTALSTISAGMAGSFGGATRALVLVGSVMINAAIFVFAFRLATTRRLTVRDVLPGALLAAVLAASRTPPVRPGIATGALGPESPAGARCLSLQASTHSKRGPPPHPRSTFGGPGSANF